MIVVRGERYEFKVYKRKKNSPYEWEENVAFIFYGRPANQMEKRNYRVQKGTNGNSDSIYCICSNLPEELDPKDKVVFLGKEWTVESTGYYFDSSYIVNASVLSDKQIIERCPKGINLQ